MDGETLLKLLPNIVEPKHELWTEECEPAQPDEWVTKGSPHEWKLEEELFLEEKEVKLSAWFDVGYGMLALGIEEKDKEPRIVLGRTIIVTDLAIVIEPVSHGAKKYIWV